MKKITFLFTLLTVAVSFGQNLVVNGDFETPGTSADPIPAPWAGFKNRIITDDITSSFVGQGENSDSSMFQTISVTPGQQYDVTFDYRWVTSAAANSNMTVRVKDAANLPNNLTFTDTSTGFVLNTTVDQWFSGSFSVVIPAGITAVRLLFFKGTGNKPLNLDDISMSLNVLSIEDFEQFDFKIFPNPVKDFIKLSANQNIDKIEIYNLIGQQVLTKSINHTNAEINIEKLSKGIYLAKTFIGNSAESYKLIKE